MNATAQLSYYSLHSSTLNCWFIAGRVVFVQIPQRSTLNYSKLSSCIFRLCSMKAEWCHGKEIKPNSVIDNQWLVIPALGLQIFVFFFSLRKAPHPKGGLLHTAELLLLFQFPDWSHSLLGPLHKLLMQPLNKQSLQPLDEWTGRRLQLCGFWAPQYLATAFRITNDGLEIMWD